MAKDKFLKRKEDNNTKELLTFQSGCVPDRGVTILRQHHFPHHIMC
jgi:hypothetical protein